MKIQLTLIPSRSSGLLPANYQYTGGLFSSNLTPAVNGLQAFRSKRPAVCSTVRFVLQETVIACSKTSAAQ